MIESERDADLAQQYLYNCSDRGDDIDSGDVFDAFIAGRESLRAEKLLFGTKLFQAERERSAKFYRAVEAFVDTRGEVGFKVLEDALKLFKANHVP